MSMRLYVYSGISRLLAYIALTRKSNFFLYCDTVAGLLKCYHSRGNNVREVKSVVYRPT